MKHISLVQIEPGKVIDMSNTNREIIPYICKIE